MHDTALFLRREERKYLAKDKPTLKTLEQWSIKRWAMEQVIDLVGKSIPDKEILIAEKFTSKMEDYACKSHPKSWMFSVARDSAMLMVDLLITYKERRKNETEVLANKAAYRF